MSKAKYLINAGTLRIVRKNGKAELHGVGAQTNEDVLITTMDGQYFLDPNKDYELLCHLDVELAHPVQTYRVRWEIDVDAETPVAAAMQALEMVSDPNSSAHVFDAVDESGQMERIDLDELLGPYERGSSKAKWRRGWVKAMNRQLTQRELATVLAALRYWQHDIELNGVENFIDAAGFFTEVMPLTAEEIDVLAEALNCSDFTLDDLPDTPINI